MFVNDMSAVKIPLRPPVLDFEEVLVYDPGGTTGFARLRVNKAQKLITVIEIGEFNTWEKVFDHVKEINDLKKHSCTCVVYEGFTCRTLAANLIPVEVIGVIRALCSNSCIHHYKQEPHERLAVEKWYPNIYKFPSHYGSAVRHGVHFCVSRLFDKRIVKLEWDMKMLMETFLN
jgi:hypothetical protein